MTSTSLCLSVDTNSYGKHFPNYQYPSVLGCFSLDSNRTFCPDMSQLKYLYIPRSLNSLHFNLNHKLKESIKKDDSLDEKLDNLLKWILSNKDHLKKDSETRIYPEFVCWRGLLTLLLTTPYEKRDGWIICATKWKGTIYLCAYDTDEKIKQRNNASAFVKRCMSWGYKFEQYLTTDTPNSTPVVNSAINENEEFCVTFKTSLGKHKLLIGAEMDGVTSSVAINSLQELSKSEFIELKTRRFYQSENQEKNSIRNKYIKWWAQSFLVGIKKLFVGIRDDNGIVHEIEIFDLKKIVELAKEHWNPSICMNFCESFLRFAKDVVQVDDFNVVYKFTWNPRDPNVTFSKIDGPSEYCFLPPWYIDNI